MTTSKLCRPCQRHMPPEAQYCWRCGRKLGPEESCWEGLPDTVGERFEIVGHLARGGMSELHLTTDKTTGEAAVLKTLPTPWRERRALRLRFGREIALHRAIAHPAMPAVLGAGRLSDGSPWMAMAHIPGEDLSALIEREGPTPPQRALPILLQLARSVALLHRKGVIHRDLKPSNVRLSRSDDGHSQVWLLDLGVARSFKSSARLTEPGMAVGTVGFAALEQLRGQQLDARADVYSLGALAFTMLAGVAPYDAHSPAEIAGRQLRGDIPHLSCSHTDVEPWLADIVARAMSPKRHRRMPTALCFADQLSQRTDTLSGNTLVRAHNDRACAGVFSQNTKGALGCLSL